MKTKNYGSFQTIIMIEEKKSTRHMSIYFKSKHILPITHKLKTAGFGVVLFFCLSTSAYGQQKARIVILTDVGVQDEKDQKDRDDIQSLVRLLLYSNELDIEGLIATKSRKNSLAINDHTQNILNVFPETIFDVVDGYEKVYPNLKIHDSDYPSPDHLRSIIKQGNSNKHIPWSGSDEMKGIGPGKNTEASDHIIDILQKSDTRPVWFCIWGKAIDLAQALSDIKTKHSPQEVKQITSKIKVYDIVGQDNTGAWIAHTFPEVFYIRSLQQFRAFGDTKIIGNDSFITDAWADTHVRSHGPLGKKYIVNHLTLKDKAFHFEGDSPSFMYLINNGLGDPDQPHYGGWGGRFTKEKQKNIHSLWSADAEKQFEDFWMFTDTGDTWKYEDSLYKENIYAPIARWRLHYQNDFQARMDWSIRSYKEANHPPRAVFHQNKSKETVFLNCKPGDVVNLNAGGSKDPDGDKLFYYWSFYPEPGTYKGEIKIDNQTTAHASFIAPAVSDQETLHVILTVADDGEPNLHSYRRIIIHVKP